jgi:diaminohydroxyphosphoribosylaminopyrimidine deaminase/5-amino-6-(5-phosphoribosylamino)uracil reductase
MPIFVLMSMDECYMQRCLELAWRGVRSVYPNPMVGCVIVKNNHIVGEGYHQEFGQAHAEIQAIQSVSNLEDLDGATLYVSLEPCFHTGKTPPCIRAILQYNFKRIVIACQDPNPKVSGLSISSLKKHGYDVTVGVLENEAKALNKRFFINQLRQRPYIILKWAQSPDGYMDRLREEGDKGIHWITSPDTQTLVHKWRSEEHAILVGRKTIENDDPSLTVRSYSGIDPIRIIIDSQLQVPTHSKVFKESSKVLIFNKIKEDVLGNIEYIKSNDINTQSLLDALFARGIASVFVEGGSKTLHHFIFRNIWDEARIIVGGKPLHEGLKAPGIPLIPTNTYSFSNDKVYEYLRS